ncbi:NAD nucleotidase [Treponema phagedenis]|uniref:NAD nucleotidase n=1 Tax=Treponema phagedenis TaxID=162 RepID=A0AAE6ISJ6_TREPH|nr:NAD nucleotidase [Treponema phagedenis]NVP24988.1 NAD nucleotidase [Treponema phagedenis]QEJ97106.1 NAD nucleotidase [Treponema phagedenis]QEK02704.1 NAD nucleotidase [Treponema phagedenis]QEK08333.1 NAD nucleotidase [Treponema phagedenis]QLC59306.1 NAD nucleotidase [Treponema phagedenis]
MKKNLKLLVSILLAVSFSFSGFAAGKKEASTKSEELELSIIHINDHHSKLEPSELRINIEGKQYKVDVGGYSAINHKIKELHATRKNPLVLHAGDAIVGTLYFTLFEGAADAAVMNEGGIDFFTLGNHEFDTGNEGLLKLLTPLKVPVVSANVVPDKGSILENKWKPYEIIEIEGQKIGIIGLDTVAKTVNSSSPGKDIQFYDEVETARKYADLLTGQGINKIILLSHGGAEKNFEIAQKVDGIDIIITGDSHYLFGNDELRSLNLPVVHEYPMEFKSPNGNPVYVVEAWCYSYMVGNLGVKFDKDGIATITRKIPHFLLHDTKFTSKVDGKWTPATEDQRKALVAKLSSLSSVSWAKDDPKTAEILAKYKKDLDELSQRVIGSITGNPMPGGSANRIPGRPGADPRGSVATRFVAETMLNQLDNVDLTIQNSGGVRADINPGDITFADAYTFLPFGNTLYTYNMSGADIKQVLEDALDFALTQSTGAFPYGAGIRYEANEFPQNGKRLVKVEVQNRNTERWEPIDDAKIYLVGTNAYIAAGKDGYATFGRLYNDPAAQGVDTFLPDAESFIKFMRNNPTFKAYTDSNVKFNVGK